MPVSVSVEVKNGEQVAKWLSELANAAAVFGRSKSKVGTNDLVGLFVEEGTDPHMIYPRNKKALWWPGARHPVGKQGVRHPGTKANPFLQRAVDKSAPEVERFVTAQLEQVAAGRGSNYSQIMQGVGKIVVKAAKAEAPVGPTTETRKGGTLRASLYMV